LTVVLSACGRLGFDPNSGGVGVGGAAHAAPGLMIISSPPTAVMLDTLYTYDASSTADVGEVWTLVAGSSGMTIDRELGLVEWTAGGDRERGGAPRGRG
jgi:hypothetical protein